MTLTNKLVIVSTLALAAACGKATKQEASQNPAAPQAQAVEKPADLPVAAIVRVPVGESGKEDPSKAELRLESGSTLASSTAEAVAAFENGKVPASVKSSHDELDKDSSTQSWFFGSLFRNYNYYYNYGYNYGIGYGNYNNYYSYGYRNNYNYGGYNYYYYPYSGYGYGY
jgi:hypothetical protein